VNEAEIWLSCKDDLVRYAAVLIGPADAEDVVSTVVVRVLSRRTLAGLNDARRYLFKAVLNESRTRAVRRHEVPTVKDLSEPPPPEPQPEVMEAVLSLPVAQRAATYLVYWADLSIAETARLMGTRPGTVKRYLHLARAKLKGALHEPERIHTDR
jgi:RNA polymerase sigma factor (sigma-70 family)